MGEPRVVHTDIDKYNPNQLCILYTAVLQANKEILSEMIYKPAAISAYIIEAARKSEEVLLKTLEEKIYIGLEPLTIES